MGDSPSYKRNVFMSDPGTSGFELPSPTTMGNIESGREALRGSIESLDSRLNSLEETIKSVEASDARIGGIRVQPVVWILLGILGAPSRPNATMGIPTLGLILSSIIPVHVVSREFICLYYTESASDGRCAPLALRSQAAQ